jgi:membrane fusion protein
MAGDQFSQGHLGVAQGHLVSPSSRPPVRADVPVGCLTGSARPQRRSSGPRCAAGGFVSWALRHESAGAPRARGRAQREGTPVSSLFRPEAVEAQRQQWLGRVQLVRPLSLTVLTVAVAAVALSCWHLPVRRRVHAQGPQVSGVLAPDRGLIRLVPPVAGTVIERRVDEGRAVRAGEVLFVLAQDRSHARCRRAGAGAAQLGRAPAQPARGLAAATAARSRATHRLRPPFAGAGARAGADRGRGRAAPPAAALAQQSLERLESLAADQFISSAQVQAKSEELLALRAQAQALERQRAGLARERAELEGERAACRC